MSNLPLSPRAFVSEEVLKDNFLMQLGPKRIKLTTPKCSRFRVPKCSSLLPKDRKSHLMPKSSYYRPNILSSPQEIGAVLDPLLYLPLDLSTDDRTLLHYYLYEGRRKILGTSTRPKHDLVFDVASRQMQNCPIYVLARINISEYMIASARKKPCPPRLYERTAKAYRLAKDILSRPSAPIQVKASALLNLQMMEAGLGQKPMQAVHLRALDILVSCNGGLSSLLKEDCNGIRVIKPVDLLGQCMWGIGYIANQRASFDSARSNLRKSLRSIRAWVAKNDQIDTNASSTRNAVKQSSRLNGNRTLFPLKSYLHYAVNTYLRDGRSDDFGHAPTTLNLLFNICLTFARFEYSVEAANSTLEKLQILMEASIGGTMSAEEAFHIGGPDNLYALHPNQVFSTFCHIRCGGCVKTPASIVGRGHLTLDHEVELCALSIDAAKLFSMMTRPTRLRMARSLLQCVFASETGVKRPCFEAGELFDLNAELESSWSVAQGPNTVHT